MEKMVEPDRTIVIVSIIGLVIIWGSVLYHKWVQSRGESGERAPAGGAEAEAALGASQARKKKKKKKR